MMYIKYVVKFTTELYKPRENNLTRLTTSVSFDDASFSSFGILNDLFYYL